MAYFYQLSFRLFILLIAVFFSGSAQSQTVAPQLATLLKAKLVQQRTNLNVKGLGAAVRFPDGSIWADGAGISSQFPIDSMDAEHVFGLGSITKTITAATVMQLADEGLVHLDSSISTYIGPFTNVNPSITIRQLLRHQSGIFDFVYSPNFNSSINSASAEVWTHQEVMDNFVQAPYFAPGAGWRYSNTNYVLLAMIVEQVTGEIFHDVVRARILQPHGLSEFAYLPYEQPSNPFAHVWLDLDGNGTVEDAHNIFSNFDSYHTATGPAGSYYCNPTDVARWLHLLLATDSILSPDMLTQAKTTVTSNLNAGTRYGLGLMQRNFSNQQAFGHGGDSGYSGMAWYFPARDLTIVVLNNDQRKISWDLAPVVSGLLTTYTTWLTTPTDEQIGQVQLSVQPNPFTSSVFLDVEMPQSSSVTCMLYNTYGQVVHTSKMELSAGAQQVAIRDLEALPAGMYQLSLQSENGIIGTKTVVKI
jgi:D-alanyl-D-alanine carboxypeptidase